MAFVFLALIVALLSSQHVASELDVIFAQEPNPVKFDGTVTVTCSAVEEKEILPWEYPNGDAIEVDKSLGVIRKGQGVALRTLELNLSNFAPERTLSCGLKEEEETLRDNYTICVSWDIIHRPQNITVHDGDEGPRTMSCVVVEDCIAPPSPWLDPQGNQVKNDTNKGITVTPKPVAGTTTVVEWELKFTKLSQKDMPNFAGTYTCSVPDSTASATLKRAESRIVHPPQSITTVSKVDTAKTLSCMVAEDDATPPNPWRDQDGEGVKNDTEKGIEVTPKPVSDTVVEWELRLTKLSQEVIPKDGVKYTCSVSTGAVSAIIKWAESRIVHPPQSITTVSKVDTAKTLSCMVAEDGTTPPNPWLDQEGEEVKTDAEKGIEVTPKPVSDTVVEWELRLTKLSQEVIPKDGVKYTCSASTGAVSAIIKWADTNSQDDSSGNHSTLDSGQGPTSSSTSVSSTLSSDITSSPVSTTSDVESTTATTSVNTSTPASTSTPTPSATSTVKKAATDNASPSPTSTPKGEPGGLPSKIFAIAVAVVVLVILCGVVYVVYRKRHTLRDWLMDKDVVKVIKKQKKGKGYRYSKLPRDITTSMKHLE